MKVKSIIISGFPPVEYDFSTNPPTTKPSGYLGQSWYEWCCQCMLFDGIMFIKHKMPSIWDGTKTLFGVASEGNILGAPAGTEIKFYGMMRLPNAFKPLEKWWIDKYSPSGAMHQAVSSHLMVIHNIGYDKWIETARKKRGDEDIIEFDIDVVRQKLEEHWNRK